MAWIYYSMVLATAGVAGLIVAALCGPVLLPHFLAGVAGSALTIAVGAFLPWLDR